jgi:4-hydroxy-4-methyl-2-oxoglutarate aldolase
MEAIYPISIGEMCERYKKLYTGAVGDILDKRGYRDQILPYYINPIRNDMLIAGPAFTGYGESHNDPTENDTRMRLAMLEEITPHSISVWATHGNFSAAHWGEIMSTAARERGCTGAVLDGGVRDTSFILEMNFPVFCRFKCSASSIGRWSIRKFQVPILIGQTQIVPDDFIIGDIDGVVVIPQAVAYEVLTEAEEISALEREMRAELRKGARITEVYKKYGSF